MTDPMAEIEGDFAMKIAGWLATNLPPAYRELLGTRATLSLADAKGKQIFWLTLQLRGGK